MQFLHLVFAVSFACSGHGLGHPTSTGNYADEISGETEVAPRITGHFGIHEDIFVSHFNGYSEFALARMDRLNLGLGHCAHWGAINFHDRISLVREQIHQVFVPRSCDGRQLDVWEIMGNDIGNSAKRNPPGWSLSMIRKAKFKSEKLSGLKGAYRSDAEGNPCPAVRVIIGPVLATVDQKKNYLENRARYQKCIESHLLPINRSLIVCSIFFFFGLLLILRGFSYDDHNRRTVGTALQLCGAISASCGLILWAIADF